MLLAVGASSASAAPNQIWRWACHGPNGEALPGTTYQQAKAYDGTISGGCNAPNSAIELGLTSDGTKIRGLSEARVVFHALPSDTIATQVKLNRTFTNFGQTSASQLLGYSAGGTQSGPLDDEVFAVNGAAPANGEVVRVATSTADHGDALTVGLKCASSSPNDPCAAEQSPSVRLVGAAVQVVESINGVEATDAATAPKIAVGGVRNEMANGRDANGNPTIGVPIEIRATDAGSGLATAFVQIDDLPAQVANFTGGSNCVDLTPDTLTIVDMPMDAVCPTVDTVTINLDTWRNGTVANGPHRLRVGVYDWSGRYTELTDESLSGDKRPIININNNPFYGSPTAELQISTGATTTPQGGSPPPSSEGGVAGASSQSCRTPRLSVTLADKPLRISKGRPVLRANKRYKFTGRLTCVINGRRVSAPKRARIDLLNTVGKKTTDKSGTTVAAKGRFEIILAYPSSRLLTFRFTNTDGQRSQVRIRIVVEKKKKKSKR